MREGVRFVNDILMSSEGMKDIVGEDYPWPHATSLGRSDEQSNLGTLANWIP